MTLADIEEGAGVFVDAKVFVIQRARSPQTT